MSHDAYVLVRGARLERTIGKYAARRYVELHLINLANFALWTQCRVLANAERAGLCTL